MVKELKPVRHDQAGAVTLLITLLLMISITIVTLAVTQTTLMEQRMANNDNWNTRLSLQAEAGLAKGFAYLSHSRQSVSWKQAADNHTLIHRLTMDSADPHIQTDVVFSRQADYDQYIHIQVTSSSDAVPTLRAGVSQTVRPLSVLTPLAESAPPLILTGCLTSIPVGFDIRPRNADSDQAGDSVWLNEDRSCATLHLIDIHNGLVQKKKMEDDLWSLIFSLSREEFRTLSNEENTLADGERNYWLAQHSDLSAGRWNRSLGNADRPVALHFTAAIGCPVFADGVRLYGVVFIDTDCPEPIAEYGFEIFGALIVNGNLNTANTKLRLNHIQLANAQQTRLQFPLLRSVAVPGTWKDF